MAIRRAVSSDVGITKYAFYPVPLRPVTAIVVTRIGLNGCKHEDLGVLYSLEQPKPHQILDAGSRETGEYMGFF